LQTLDLERAAEDHIHKTLLKIKSIASSNALPPSVKLPSRAVVDNASLNVLARLYKATPVQSAMKTLISDIQDILGLENAGTKSPSSKTKGPSQVAERKPSAKQRDDISEDEEYPEYDARIAASSDEDDSAASGNEVEIPAFPGVLRNKAKPRIGLSVSPPPSSEEGAFEGFSDPFEESPELERKSRPSNASESTPVKSTFVPSLTVGGYWSGSESEPEDDVDVQPKKNRRGQRARQQLAEKKFGQEAKHIKNGTSANRDKGWDLKRGAQVSHGSRGRNGKYRPGDWGGPRSFASDANTVELNPSKPQKPKKDDTGPLHPSWQAAKLAKEKKQTASFQGKKVVFD
jgi:hypothetical protein